MAATITHEGHTITLEPPLNDGRIKIHPWYVENFNAQVIADGQGFTRKHSVEGEV